MRIGFVSYEFPPETGGGGIGTYLDQMTRLLAVAGHDVVVFAGAKETSSAVRLMPSLEVRRVACDTSIAFRDAVLEDFTACHTARPFDVIEGCDFDASALEIKRAFPGLPYVVKLHTPRFLVDELNYRPPELAQLARMWLGALRKGNRLKIANIRESDNARAELDAIRMADEVAAPSRAIGETARCWSGVETDVVSVFPLPFDAPAILLNLPIGPEYHRVTFLGRIEMRKGVEDLADAIPMVLKSCPATRFRFVGRPMLNGKTGLPYDKALQKRLGASAASVEFTGQVTPSEAARALGETDILVAPSHWESFGLVCCEGMAAGRAVIGSSAGGMAEILDHGRCGVLVPPMKPEILADAIIRLIKSPEERASLGALARQRVRDVFSAEAILPAQIASYERAIRRVHEGPEIRKTAC